MWATHRGLSKPCANRASCPSPSGSGGSRWNHRFLSEQIGEQDDSFAVRTAASESHRASVQVAVRAAPLAKEALATTRTFVDGVRHEQSLALELLAEDDQIDAGALEQLLADDAATACHTLMEVQSGATLTEAAWPARGDLRLCISSERVEPPSPVECHFECPCAWQGVKAGVWLGTLPR